MRIFSILVGLTLALATAATAADFKPYPGARVDEAGTQAARQAAAQSPLQTKEMVPTIYLTQDPFEKVAAFYRGLAREYRMPGQQDRGPQKLPGGQELKEAYFIFDGAKDLVTSRCWAKVQRPYIGGVKMEGFTPQYQDIREVTVIILSAGK
ncbi:MAG: hypothetical protein A2Z73_05535 [Deltaproteobacteria bacterium RBG_13_60_28]|nr:MAG: hypothetical protein A2Z73_05535 [Deltaproteobacteria bacterium RBG_13_60_28]